MTEEVKLPLVSTALPFGVPLLPDTVAVTSRFSA
jgi:hypothetical protein